ncbi:hypothetical protein, partial [Escherichia coli]|uniref:hypothetical protein n=1 Tax=Escherichia coli TaxID=562 RepID=UPI0011158FBD
MAKLASIPGLVFNTATRVVKSLNKKNPAPRKPLKITNLYNRSAKYLGEKTGITLKMRRQRLLAKIRIFNKTYGGSFFNTRDAVVKLMEKWMPKNASSRNLLWQKFKVKANLVGRKTGT